MRALVTGATGYVGSRLVPALIEGGHEVVAGARTPSRVAEFAWGDRVEARKLDVHDADSVAEAAAGIDVAYYLVHSMSDADFMQKDAENARAFADGVARAGVGRVVYLSGLVPNDAELSDHLRSRLEVEDILAAGRVPSLALRAAILIGAGSTSFELVRGLVEQLPTIPIPTWMDREIQPVATADVVDALVAAGEGEPRTGHQDVGGPDTMPYAELIAAVAKIAGLTRPQVPLPGVPHRVVGLAAAQITGVPRNTVIELVESLKHDMVAEPDEAAASRVGVEDAIRRAYAADKTGTAVGGDRQTGADTDPDWSGGEVELDGARRVLSGHGILARLRGTSS